jgi:hypothetical protein
MEDFLSMQIVQTTDDVPRDMSDLLIRHFHMLTPPVIQKATE